MFFGSPEVTKRWRRERVTAKQAPQLAISSLLGYPPVAGYAKARVDSGASPSVTVIAADKWTSFYAQRQAGETDPQTGKPKTDEQLRREAVDIKGFTATDGTKQIYLEESESKPATLIHEAVHWLAVNDVRDFLGKAVNEGMTEFFARRIEAATGQHLTQNSGYDAETSGVAALAKLVGEEPIAAALFAGKVLALESAAEAKVPGAFARWKLAMQDPAKISTAPDALTASAPAP